MATNWMESIAAFERNLEEWLTRAGKAPPDATLRPTEPILLRLFDERLQGLQTQLDRAETLAANALTPLDEDLQALDLWLDTWKKARIQLLERTARRAS